MTTAFQPDAFQKTPIAFQIEQMGSTAFQQCAFQYPGFQTIPCEGASAQSGIRRLEMYRLQEEALEQWEKRNDEQEQGEKAPRRAGEVAEAKPIRPSGKKRRADTKRERVAETKPVAPVIPFRRKRYELEASVPEKLAKVPPLVFNWYSEALVRSQLIISLDAERIKRRRKRRQAAALLLMAA